MNSLRNQEQRVDRLEQKHDDPEQADADALARTAGAVAVIDAASNPEEREALLRKYRLTEQDVADWKENLDRARRELEAWNQEHAFFDPEDDRS